jgi:lipopolysaccharide export system protein LptA
MELMKRICTSCFLVLGLVTFLIGEIQISESVTQFRYPKFSENGFIEWVLEGNSGTYSQSNISIEELRLRIYSGDQSARSLSNISGDNCTFDSDTEVATSDDSISIKGSGFNLSGNQWTYDLSEEIITLNSDAMVRFSESIDTVFSNGAESGETTIKSNRMRLVIEPTRYLFTFEGNCTLSSNATILESDFLELELLNNSNKVSFSIPSGELSGMKSISGKGDVEFISKEQYVQSERFTIIPLENKARFEGNALMRHNQIVLKGDQFDLKQNNVDIVSFDNNLSSFSNTNVNEADSGLGYDNTLIQSKNIFLSKQDEIYQYTFDKDVFYLSDIYRINAEWLYLETQNELSHNSSDMLQNIQFTEAKENVLVKRTDYEISGEFLKYLPTENKLEIRNNVNYISDFAKLKSDHLIIENNELVAHSNIVPIKVILPHTNDLSFEINENLNSSDSESKSDTITYAKSLKIKNVDSFYDCIFREDVKLIHANDDFSMETEKLTMQWKPLLNDSSKYALERIDAEGSVIMEEKDYYASANHVKILPEQKLLHFRDNAHFKDNNGSIWGDHITFDRKLKQTKVSGSRNGERARIQFDIFGTEEENLEE